MIVHKLTISFILDDCYGHREALCRGKNPVSLIRPLFSVEAIW
jgi:hypothetical protein